MTTVEKEILGSPAVQAPVSNPAVTTRDVLHRAADLLEEFGWCQGRNGSRAEGQMCIGGAVREACRDFGFEYGTGSAMHHALKNAARAFFPSGAPVWNDATGRTRAEVVARLREAAEASHE